MSKDFVKKNIKLSLEFDSYAARHPSIYKKIPNGSWVIFTDTRDTKFSTLSRTLAHSARTGKVVEAYKEAGAWKVVAILKQ